MTPKLGQEECPFIPHVRLKLPSIFASLRTTPGGTLFSTTPGGTRIIYDRDFMLQCRNSPLSRTPPAELEKMLKAVHPELDQSPQAPKVHTAGHQENGPVKGECYSMLPTTESSQFVLGQIGVQSVAN
ncbi:Eukaryotic translation initiation factor 4E-binding protein 2 [Fasciola gigantica]|uniref:Eukaryotic translation initiation factor 4E-binding protein 2 n=1 Tax=Fasciola gigantica TaxID=46835 RepID=A0A504YNJ6_FASGI|nr:Eukaryotic translation initiation factor 4E-binding protein 2 [Fasciola gigantica]